MKSVYVALCGLLAGHALASFELLYVVDRATTGIKVHRFDGDTGAYYGGFGVDLQPSANGIAINSAGEVFVSDLARIFVYNGSTGRLVREFTKPVSDYGSISLTASGDILHSNSGTSGYRLNPNNGAVLATYPIPNGGFGHTSLVEGPGGAIFGGVRGLNRVQRYTSSGTLSSQSALTDSLTDSSFGTSSNGIGYIATGVGKKVVRFDMSTSPATILPSISLAPSDFAVTGLAAGHGNRMYASIWTTGIAGYIQRFDKTTGGLRGSFGSGILLNPVNMASIVAPEPATLAALAFGTLMMTKRRRKG